ncbi:MAG: M61 family metallopeptidase [Spirosomataceae bacterium]
MHYKVYSKNPSSNFIDIEVVVSNIATETIELQLPAWRPGRYELQHFAKNIQRFEVFDNQGNKLKVKKITKDRWLVETAGASEVIAKYNYYANVINAGSSYVDENLLYVNPVNLCLYAEGRLEEACYLSVATAAPNPSPNGQGLESPISPKWADGFYHFKDFHHLVDSPFVISSTAQHDSYFVGETEFHLWFYGNIKLDFERIKADFRRFTEAQIEIFGEFPEPDYHFITIVLPTPYYHGVEHRNSTMMVLGPDNQDFEEFYIDLLGLASHELFHAWNICKIRPKELLPYDYTKENYFETCFVAEGVTTYYGDLMLSRSGVFDKKQYLKELEVCYRRHFEQAGNAFQSLTESSYDLWLDGYVAGIPDRKVSVYQKGAIAAQILDLFIQKQTNQQKSLDDVMRLLWQRFGKPFIGYSYEDYKEICEEVAGVSLDWYFDVCIRGNDSLEEMFNEYLELIDLQIVRDENNLIKLIFQP